MTTTVDHNVTSLEWTQVTTAATSVLLQLKTNGPVMVSIGASAPGSPFAGLVLSRSSGGMEAVSFDAIDGNVYVRGRDGDTEVVVVIAS